MFIVYPQAIFGQDIGQPDNISLKALVSCRCESVVDDEKAPRHDYQHKYSEGQGQEREVCPDAIDDSILLVTAMQIFALQVTPQVPTPGMEWKMRNIVIVTAYSGERPLI